MSNPLPNTLALTTINTNAQIVSSDHRNNYSAIQTAMNLLRACLAGGTAGQVVTAADGTDVEYDYPPGHQLAYTEATAPIAITATTEANANTLIDTGAIVYDGTAVIFSAEGVVQFQSGFAVGDKITLLLFDGAASLGAWGPWVAQENAVTATLPFHVERRLTPTAVSHDYKLTAFKTGAGTCQLAAGAGGAGAGMPAFARIVKA